MYILTINLVRKQIVSESFWSLQNVNITNSYGAMKGNVNALTGNALQILPKYWVKGEYSAKS